MHNKSDPYAQQIDAFTLSWDKFYAYAFPPFILLSWLLAKVQRDQATMILVCPLWPAQHWFPQLLNLLIDFPRLIPPEYKLLLPWDSTIKHPLNQDLQLLELKISGNTILTQEFQKKLPQSCQGNIDKLLRKGTHSISDSGYLLLRKGTSIPLLPL